MENEASRDLVIQSVDCLVKKPIGIDADPHDVARRQTRDYRTMDDFISQYDSRFYQKCLQNLHNAVGTTDKKVWAKEWAIRMIPEPAPDKDAELNRDRKVCLELLYTLCKRWKRQEDPSITESAIVNDFQAVRILRITEVCLPMDQAQALYKMKYDSREEIGMHWVAQQHVLESPEWQSTLKECNGFPTMNKRFLWLMEVEELNLQQQWAEWLTPQHAPYYLDQGQDPSSQLADVAIDDAADPKE